MKKKERKSGERGARRSSEYSMRAKGNHGRKKNIKRD
jgi:hypothetical protein